MKLFNFPNIFVLGILFGYLSVEASKDTMNLLKNNLLFIKWTIPVKLPMGLESHQDSEFWSNKPLFSDDYCE